MSNRSTDSDENVEEVSVKEADKNKTVKILISNDRDQEEKIYTVKMPYHWKVIDMISNIFTEGDVLEDSFGYEMGNGCLVSVNAMSNTEFLISVKTLTMSVPVRMIPVENLEYQFVMEMKSPTLRPTAHNDFSNLFDNKKFSDVTLCASGQVIYAHKIIVANKSPVFEAMFTSETRQSLCNKFEIEDIDYVTLYNIIHFMYKGQVIVDDAEDVYIKYTNLLKADDKYCVNNLKELCEVKLARMLSTENVLECLVLADSYNGIFLRKRAIDFIVKNAVDVVELPSFKNVLSLHPQMLLKLMHALVLADEDSSS